MVVMEDIERCDYEISILADKVIELGVYCEETFKNAISLLFTRDWSSAFTMFHAHPDIAPVTLVGESMSLMHRWSLASERMRIVVALQQASTEFDTILRHINEVADKANRLTQEIETYFAPVGEEGLQAFYRLINSAYIQLRGCIVALSSRQASLAENVIRQDSVLDQSYMQVQSVIHDALVLDITQTMPLGTISMLVTEIEAIGNSITRICQRIEAITQDTASFAFSPEYFVSMAI